MDKRGHLNDSVSFTIRINFLWIYKKLLHHRKKIDKGDVSVFKHETIYKQLGMLKIYFEDWNLYNLLK